MPTLQYPLINGLRYDWSSAEITINGIRFTAIKALNYKPSLDPGEVRGNRAQLLGRTRGKYSAEGSLELYLSEWDQLTTALVADGSGIYEKSFDIVASFSEATIGVVTDTLVGCRLKTGDRSNQEGNEPLVVKADLHIMYILENGKAPLNAKQFLR